MPTPPRTTEGTTIHDRPAANVGRAMPAVAATVHAALATYRKRLLNMGSMNEENTAAKSSAATMLTSKRLCESDVE